MHIVLDTTALRRDFPLDSPDMRLMRQYLQKTGSNLFVPQVVLDEIHNQHRELLEKTKSELLTNIRQLLTWSSIKLPDIDIVAESESYRLGLEKRLQTSYRARFIPYPDISHDRLVARDLSRLKPFSESGRGYRDALIWYSVISLLSSMEKEFAFVTGNTRDFWNSEKTSLHPQLIDDLKVHGIEPSRLHLFTGVDGLNTAIARPKLQMLEDVLRELQAGTYKPLDLHATLNEHASILEAEIAKRTPSSLIRDALGYLFLSIDDSSVSSMDGPTEIRVTTVVEIEAKKLFVGFIAHYDVVFNAMIPVEEVSKWERLGVVIFEPEIHGDAAEIDIELRAEARAALVFDPAAKAIENFEITELDLAPN